MEKFLPFADWIHTLTEGTRMCICVQDVDSYYAALLATLPYPYRYHLGPVCALAKSTSRGMNLCTRCKFRTVELALRHDRMWCGYCPFGVAEIVCPVYRGDRLSAMIYIGNLLWDRDVYITRSTAAAARIGLPGSDFTALLDRLCPVENGDFTPYRRRAAMLREYLCLVGENLPQPKETNY